MTEPEKKPLGRPRKYAGKRPTWTIRLEPTFGDEIRRIAEQTGRSISEVCERQIVNSFRLETEAKLLRARVSDLEDRAFRAETDLRDARTEINLVRSAREIDRWKTQRTGEDSVGELEDAIARAVKRALDELREQGD